MCKHIGEVYVRKIKFPESHQQSVAPHIVSNSNIYQPFTISVEDLASSPNRLEAMHVYLPASVVDIFGKMSSLSSARVLITKPCPSICGCPSLYQANVNGFSPSNTMHMNRNLAPTSSCLVGKTSSSFGCCWMPSTSTTDMKTIDTSICNMIHSGG